MGNLFGFAVEAQTALASIKSFIAEVDTFRTLIKGCLGSASESIKRSAHLAIQSLENSSDIVFDKKNVYADTIIHSLSILRRSGDSISKIKDFLDGVSNLHAEIALLEECTSFNRLTWMFMFVSKARKERYAQAAWKINAFLKNTSCVALKQELFDMQTYATQREKHWEEFNDNFEEYFDVIEEMCAKYSISFPKANCIREVETTISEAKKALTLADAFQEVRESASTSLNSRIMHCYGTAVSAKEMYFEMGPETPAARELIHALAINLKAEKLEQNVKRFVEQDIPQIESAIKELERLLPNRDFEWFFLPRERREAIKKVDASALERIQNPDIIELQNFITSNRCAKTLNAKECWDSFLHNQSAYFAALTDHTNNAGLKLGDQHKPTGAIQQIENAKHDIQQCDGILSSIQEQLSHAKKRIKEAAQNVLTRQQEGVLAKTSVDELSRQRKRIRIALLKENGYGTILDLKKASVDDISGIEGIGWQGACEIKRASDEIIRTVEKTTTIRLDSGKQYECCTELLKAIYFQERSKDLRKDLRASSAFRKEMNPAMLSSIPATRTGLAWYFTPEQIKAKALQSMKQLLDDSEKYRQVTLETGDKFFAITDISQQEIWRDYELNAAYYYSVLEQLGAGNMDRPGDMTGGLSEELRREVENTPFEGSYLKTKLRKYQEFGVRFILHQRNVLLGDEMGLGKTIQAIAAMVSLYSAGERFFLVVCPASVLINWCREIARHSALTAIPIHREIEYPTQLWIAQGGIAVTTYDALKKIVFPTELRLSLLVADEAHYVKNKGAKRTQILGEVRKRSNRVLYMTGTPLENNVDEMCYLVSCLNPQIANEVESLKSLAQAPIFREKLAPVYFRRKREDVLRELPELIEMNEWCELTQEDEKEYYQVTVKRHFMQMRQISWNVRNIRKSSKGKRLLEIYNAAKEEHRKVAVFSFFRHTLEMVRELLGDVCLPIITGAMPPARRQEIVDQFNTSDMNAVLVSQIQAGGTGLNIQAASVVVLCEPQLKPSIENQAISRAYRMGQTRNVIVHRLLCEDSIDSHIMGILEYKKEQFKIFANDSFSGQESLMFDEKTVKQIVDAENERLQGKRTTELTPVSANRT